MCERAVEGDRAHQAGLQHEREDARVAHAAGVRGVEGADAAGGRGQDPRLARGVGKVEAGDGDDGELERDEEVAEVAPEGERERVAQHLAGPDRKGEHEAERERQRGERCDQLDPRLGALPRVPPVDGVLCQSPGSGAVDDEAVARAEVAQAPGLARRGTSVHREMDVPSEMGEDTPVEDPANGGARSNANMAPGDPGA
eukprot:scaffold102920_cov63-Phaeocystis_antarctica.AAC.1